MQGLADAHYRNRSGIENAFLIAAASPDVIALAIGLEDYTADLGVKRTRSGDESLYARMRIVNACKAAHVQPLDSVFPDFADPEGLKEAAIRSNHWDLKEWAASILVRSESFRMVLFLIRRKRKRPAGLFWLLKKLNQKALVWFHLVQND